MVPMVPVLEGEVLGPKDTVRVLVRTHPLYFECTKRDLPAGFSVGELFELMDLDGHYRYLAYMEGTFIPQDWWCRVRPKKNTVISFVPRVRGNNIINAVLSIAVVVATFFIAGPLAGALGLTSILGATAATALVSAVLVVGGTLAINALFPVSQAQNQATGDPFQSLSSIQGASNQSNPFGPIPVVRGIHRQSPFYAGKPYTEIAGDDQYLHVLFCWGYGPLDISDVRIGDTPIGEYEGVTVETKQGFPSDTPITQYPSSIDEQSLNILLSDTKDPLLSFGNSQGPEDDWVTQFTGPFTDIISVDVTAPDGAYFTDTSTGAVLGGVVVWEIQYRASGAVSWIEIAIDNFNTIVKTARRSFRWTVPATGQYQVRIRKRTGDNVDPITGVVHLTNAHDILYWTALRSMTTKPPIAFTKPLALTALRIKATNQLSGVISTLNGLTKSLVLSFSGTPGVWTPNTVSQWPPDLFRDVLQGAANARPVPDALIDIAGLEEWWTYCTANGFKFNQVRTNVGSVYDALADIAAAGRAIVTLSNGKWGVVWDRPDDPVVQHFTPRNSWGFSGSHPYPTLPHAWRIQFINELNDYTQDERYVYDDGFDVTNASVFEQLNLPGITDPTLIWRHGRFHIAQVRLRPEEISLATGWENLVCTRGDRVYVTHDVLLIGLSSGRVKSVVGQLVTFDELVNIDTTKTYGMQFRIPDAGVMSITRAVDLTGVTTGDYTQLTLIGSLTGVVAGTLFAFGETSRESAIYRVKSVSHQKDATAQLTLVDDAPAISTADQGTIPAFNPNITIPPDPTTQPPQNLIYSQVIQGPAEALVAVVHLSWQTPQWGNIKAFEVQSKNNETNGDWIRAGTVPAPLSSFDISITSSVTGSWGFRVRCLFLNDTVSGWSTLDPLFLKGVLTPLANVVSFTSVYQGGITQLSWTQIKDVRPNVVYEIRKGTDWDSGAVLGKYAHPPIPAIGDGTYWIKGFCHPGVGYSVYSTDAVSITIIGSVIPLNPKLVWDEGATGWSGIYSGNIASDGTFVRTFGAGDFLAVPDVYAIDDDGDTTVTISIATPGVVHWVSHGKGTGQSVAFATTGALPTGLTATQTYFIKTIVDVDNFTVSATLGGAEIDTSGTQSGVHTIYVDGDIYNIPPEGSGIYQIPISHEIDIGYSAPCLVSITYSSAGVPLKQNFFAYNDLFSITDFFGALANQNIDVHPQLSVSNDGVTWSPWFDYQTGQYQGRRYRARMQVVSNDPQTIAFLTSFIFAVYVPTRVDNWALVGGVRTSLSNLQIPLGGLSLTFLPDSQLTAAPFNGGVSNPNQPSLVVTILNAVSGDDVIITNLTLSGCSIQVHSAGTDSIRHVNVRPEGY